MNQAVGNAELMLKESPARTTAGGPTYPSGIQNAGSWQTPQESKKTR
jgi:hypothetical protein